MNKNIALLILAFVSPLASAEPLTGVVRDKAGEPIPNAIVEVVGTNTQARADDKGVFYFRNAPERDLELHIKAVGFAHKFVDIEWPFEEPLSVSLKPSIMHSVDVVGLPWHASNMESAQPVSVLSGDRLRERQVASLGEVLKYELGVHSSYYGPVASNPIIRGLEGPRIKITQNGLDVGDASRVGPDHAVATEASVAQQIEVLRGPATLFYGSGAIGGVINVVDNRVPRDNRTEGSWVMERGTVADENLVSGSITSGRDAIAVHLDGYWRDAGDYRLPGHNDAEAAHQSDHEDERLDNSHHEASGVNLGGSYLLDRGFVGASVGHLKRNYGIPGHSHGDEGGDVFADLSQDRLQVLSELSLSHSIFSAVNSRLGYTEYSHSEIEGGQAVTTFDNTTLEARVDLFHHALADWRGALTLHYLHSDFATQGLEAFTPSSETETVAVALMEERHFGDLLVQLGARVEHVRIHAPRFLVDRRQQEAEPVAGQAHEEAPEGGISVFSVDHDSVPVSLSAGMVWDFTSGYNLAASLTHAQRTPSATELTAFGPHLGAGLFEVGALVTVVSEGDSFRFDLSRDNVELETSNNLDLSLRKHSGDIGFVVNAFYNDVRNFYYVADTGYSVAPEDAHDHEHADAEPGESEALPVFVYQADDARLYGFEGQLLWQASDGLRLTLSSDYTRAKLREQGALPRIPPLRVSGQINYQRNAYGAELNVRRTFEQNKIAAMETPGEAYTWLDAQVTYQWAVAQHKATLYLKGSNLTDEEARVHASFLKDIAPLPGRGFALGVRADF